MSNPKILFVLSPSLVFFPFPPLAVGTLLRTLRNLKYDVDCLDLHVKLSWHSLSDTDRRQIKDALSPVVLQSYFEAIVSQRYASSIIKQLIIAVRIRH